MSNGWKMAMVKYLILATLLLLPMIIVGSSICPTVKPCACLSLKKGKGKVDHIVNCEEKNLSEAPPLKPNNFQVTVASLRLNSNNITTIDKFSFSGMTIKELILDDNPIQRIDADAFAGIFDLRKLSIAKCRLNTFPVIFFRAPNLTILNLSHNFIANIPDGAFLAAKHLNELDISFNPLTLTPASFRGLENSLTAIYLQRMNLHDVPRQALSPLRRLDWIDMGYNSIQYLDNRSFVGLPNNMQTHYGFRSNGLSSISNTTFAEAAMPIYLDLGANNLTSVDFIVDPCRFEHSNLLLDGNPIHCDCKLYDLLKYETFTPQGGMCSTPDEYKQYKLMFNKHIFDPFVIPFLRYASKKCGGTKVLGMDYDCDCKVWRKPKDFMRMRGNCTTYKLMRSGVPSSRLTDLGFYILSAIITVGLLF